MVDLLDFAKGALGVVAPTLARAFGGPLAGQAAQFVCDALGLPSGTPQDQLAAAIQNATPDQLAALRKAENDFIVKMKELDIDLERVGAGDRVSARAQTVALAQAGSAVQWAPVIVSLLVLVTFGLLAYAVMMRAVPAGSESLAMGLLEAAKLLAVSVVSYWCGSSAGSAQKTDLLYRSTPTGKS